MKAKIDYKYQSLDSKTISENYKEALDKAAEKVRKENWRCSPSMKDWKELENIPIENLTLNETKKLRNKINRVIKKTTLGSINQLLWFVSKVVLKTKTSYNIKISEKEEKIQKARKKWKEARDIADKLLKEYKEEKGNFYKVRA